VPRLADALAQRPELTDIATNLRRRPRRIGRGQFATTRRVSASRWRRSTTRSTTPSDKRIISTIFTQSNQYRVIMEADPAMLQSPSRSADLRAVASGGQVPLSAIAKNRRASRAALDQSS